MWPLKQIIKELDIDPRRDDDASPMSSHRCMLRTSYLNVDFSSSAQVKFNFKLFFLIKFLGFHAVASICENLSNHLPITTVGLILTKLWWFQHFGTSQNSIWTFFEKKIKFWGFYAVAQVKTFPLMYQLGTNVGVILKKLGWFFFSRGTDRQTGFWKKISTQSSKLRVSCRLLYASLDDGDT